MTNKTPENKGWGATAVGGAGAFQGDPVRQLARRRFLQQCGVGLGAMALGDLLAQDGVFGAEPAAPRTDMTPRTGHHAPRARAVIFLFMAGGPSQLDLFCDKPKLRQSAKPPTSTSSRRATTCPSGCGSMASFIP